MNATSSNEQQPTAYDVVHRTTGEFVGVVYITDGEVQRFEPARKPEPELYRIVWWQSLIQGMAHGETLEENVPKEQVYARVAYWRISLAGGVGVQIGSGPMSWIPEGDKRKGEE